MYFLIVSQYILLLKKKINEELVGLETFFVNLFYYFVWYVNLINLIFLLVFYSLLKFRKSF